MSHKVLIVDDSKTIHKVINITLADYGLELVSCEEEDGLFDTLENSSIDLILLDYNFSNKMLGHELAKLIREKSPQSAIMAMLGAFDNIEEHLIQGSGIVDTIVKPFETDEFVMKVQDILNNLDQLRNTGINSGGETEEQAIPDKIDEPEAEEDLFVDEDNLWQVDTKSIEEPSKIEEKEVEPAEKNVGIVAASPFQDSKLGEELASWGMNVPPIIDGNSKADPIDEIGLPPVIEASSAVSENPIIDREEFAGQEEKIKQAVQKTFSNEEIPNVIEDDDDLEVEVNASERPTDTEEGPKMPEASDLEYPDLILEEEIPSEESISATPEQSEPTSKLIPLDDLQNDTDEELEITTNIESVKEINEQIHPDLIKEIEKEKSSEEFWAVDDESKTDVESVPSKVVEGKRFEETTKIELAALQEAQKPVQEPVKIDIDVDAIAKEIEEKLRPMMDEMVKKYCNQAIEKVAWEVIPDLAENLIKKELDHLRSSVER